MTQEEVYKFIKEKKEVTAKQVQQRLGITTASVYKCLNRLVKSKYIIKIELKGDEIDTHNMERAGRKHYLFVVNN